MSRRVACGLLIVLAAPCDGFSAAPLPGRLLVRADAPLSPLRPHRALALTGRKEACILSPLRRGAVVASAAAARPSLPRTFVRAALACAASILAFIFATARYALAAERTIRRASSASGFAISGDVVKYGFVGACMAASYFFRKEETPVLRETPGAVTLDPETLKAPEAPEAPAAATEAEPETTEPVLNLDDSAMFGSLAARMKALAEERDAPEQGDANAGSADAPPTDTTDGWGTGSTAMLERPQPEDGDKPPATSEGPRGVLDGEPPLQFPPGFPIVDGEVIEADDTPAASADQIAMLNRMFGSQE